MFYKDENNIDICQFGTGDVLVAGIEMPNVRPKELVGVVFGETEKGEIDRRLKYAEGKFDNETGVKFKLYFTKPESIDVVINCLKEQKKFMEKDLLDKSE